MNTITLIATTRSGISRSSQNEAGEWMVEKLLGDKDVRCLAVNPHIDGAVYAGTQENGVLRSGDGGRTWHPAGLEGKTVKSLAVSLVHRGTIYAGTKPAEVYVSYNGGDDWGELDSFRNIRSRRFWFSPAEKSFTAYIQNIVLSPTDPNVLIAGIEAGAVVRSGDGGKTWSDHLGGALRDCHTLFYHPNNGEWVYEAGGTGAGAAYSRDAGKTWQQTRDGLDRHYGWACAADPEKPEVWYVSASPSFSWRHFTPVAHIDGQANACIYRSAGGAPWQKLSGGLPQPLNYMAYALLTDPSESGHLYAGLSNGDVWFSNNFGDAWTQLPFNMGRIERTMILFK